MIPEDIQLKIYNESQSRYIYMPTKQGDYDNEQRYVKNRALINKHRKTFMSGAEFGYGLDRVKMETLQKRLDDTEKERQILINHIITISTLKEQSQSTQDLFHVLQAIDKASEYLK